jgi:hypothetical protein
VLGVVRGGMLSGDLYPPTPGARTMTTYLRLVPCPWRGGIVYRVERVRPARADGFVPPPLDLGAVGTPDDGLYWRWGVDTYLGEGAVWPEITTGNPGGGWVDTHAVDAALALARDAGAS